MSYININTKQILEVADIIKELSNVTLPNKGWDDELLAPFGFAELHYPGDAPIAGIYEELVEGTPVFNEALNKWERAFAVRSIVPTDAENLALFIQDEKTKLKAKVTSLRYDMEVVGFTTPSDVRVKTDRESQAKINEALSYSKLNPTAVIDWKSASGEWVELTADEISEIALAVGQYIQTLFSKEKAHHVAIDSLTSADELANYDILTNWV